MAPAQGKTRPREVECSLKTEEAQLPVTRFECASSSSRVSTNTDKNAILSLEYPRRALSFQSAETKRRRSNTESGIKEVNLVSTVRS